MKISSLEDLKQLALGMAKQAYGLFFYTQEQKEAASTIQRFYREYRQKKLMRAHSVEWVHGSNSHVLFPVMLNGGMLKSTGSLIKEGVFPITGEHRDGTDILRDGINIRPQVSGGAVIWKDGACSLAMTRYYAEEVSNNPAEGLSKDSFLDCEFKPLPGPFKRLTGRSGSLDSFIRYQSCYYMDATYFYYKMHDFTMLRAQYALLGKVGEEEHPRFREIHEYLEVNKDNPLCAFNSRSIDIMCDLYENPRLDDDFDTFWQRLPVGLQGALTALFENGNDQDFKAAFNNEAPGEFHYPINEWLKRHDVNQDYYFYVMIYGVIAKYNALKHGTEVDLESLDDWFSHLKGVSKSLHGIVSRFYAPIPEPLPMEAIAYISSQKLPVIFGATLDLRAAGEDNIAFETGYKHYGSGQAEIVIKHDQLPLVLGENIRTLITSLEGKAPLMELMKDQGMSDKVWVYSFEDFEGPKMA